ncbi:hypothetical protein LPY66_06095 [Dehalobacter sp. DCM]|uniref:hypothetical protein n=1 Tax=Dehalobacter sp. DCM TaxID=2907827 RepID=UPI003081A398|nr:hypothetical protein LPY66_06095 [Dehalobacter sp. DCM]
MNSGKTILQYGLLVHGFFSGRENADSIKFTVVFKYDSNFIEIGGEAYERRNGSQANQ